MAPANKTNTRGEPDFLVSGIPAEYTGLPPLERPEIYHGEDMSGYSIVGTDQTELSTDQVTTQYEGTSGVGLGSFPRKAAFALRFGEIEPLISGNLTDDSKVIYIRDVKERVQTVAPFLVLDEDPYPVLVDGRIKYVIDGYTSSSNYPYARGTGRGRGGPGPERLLQLPAQQRQGHGRRLRRHRHAVPGRTRSTARRTPSSGPTPRPSRTCSPRTSPSR